MLTPPEIARSLLAAGESKARLPFGKMLLLAILAGAYIALAGVGATAAAVTVESGSLAKLLSACVFPAGLSMVILAGSELFTGNCLMVMALLERRITPAQLLRNWLTVYLGNAMGGAAVAAKIGEIMGVDAGDSVKKLAQVHCTGCGQNYKKYEYVGLHDCVAASLLPGGGELGCAAGCALQMVQ